MRPFTTVKFIKKIKIQAFADYRHHQGRDDDAVDRRKYGKPNVAIFNSSNFIFNFVFCIQLCV